MDNDSGAELEIEQAEVDPFDVDDADEEEVLVEEEQEAEEKIDWNQVYFDKFKPELDENNRFRKLDERTIKIFERVNVKMNDEKTLLEQAEEGKPPIEKQLEENEKRISLMIDFGNQLITNIKVSNQKREVKRQDNENMEKLQLAENVKKESLEAMAQYEEIMSRWNELNLLEEPLELYEEFNKQKELVRQLMASKDAMIEECENEIRRISDKYNQDQYRNGSDLCCMAHRIDNQIELMKMCNNNNIDLLRQTVDDEQHNIKMEEDEKFEEFYKNFQFNQEHSHDNAKQKQEFYAKKIAQIWSRQEDITREVRVRLEKTAEQLEWELRNAKNQIFIQSEKLDYNYQVLMKRNEEDIIINNQQKRRVTKMKELILNLNQKISTTSSSTANSLERLNEDIKKLHSNITKLQYKFKKCKEKNKSTFFQIWNYNVVRLKQLIDKYYEIDRIVYEQQLLIPWPGLASSIDELGETLNRRITRMTIKKRKSTKNFPTKPDNIPSKDKLLDKAVDIQLLRNILRKIANRAGFLVEERLIKILQPYGETQKCLVRIDNIFSALGIRNMEVVESLVIFFEPYSWCPNCQDGLNEKVLSKLFTTDESIDDNFSSIMQMSSSSTTTSSQKAPCHNHYLVTEPALALTALNDFMSHRAIQKTLALAGGLPNEDIQGIVYDEATIRSFWRSFLVHIPDKKLKLWEAMEHGLNHYIHVLKKRSKLDAECMFLQRQNVELKHLLQKYKV